MAEFNVVISDSYFKRNEVKSDIDKLYLFTENLNFTSGLNPIDPTQVPDSLKKQYKGKCYPTSSQAVIRGLGNAYPIITKKGNGYREYFEDTDEDYSTFTNAVDKCIDFIERSGKKTIVVSAGGFATDHAALPYNFAAYLSDVLENRLNIYTRIYEHPNGEFYGLIPYNPQHDKLIKNNARH